MKNFKIDFIEQPESFTEKEMDALKGGKEPCNCKCFINLKSYNVCSEPLEGKGTYLPN